MFSKTVLAVAAFAALASAAATNTSRLPSLDVPRCPSKGFLRYNLSSPDRAAFPETAVEICYDDSTLHVDLWAYGETDWYYNSSLTTNGAIYNYEVMEVFIALGWDDPTIYFEFEVAPNNVTFNAFDYNPSTNRSDGAAFDTLFLSNPVSDGLVANTTLDAAAGTWLSAVQFPLALFNVDGATAAGTQWRMNFVRITTSPATWPTRISGAWSTEGTNNLNDSPYFGHVTFV